MTTDTRTLFEIGEDLRAIHASLLDTDGELTASIEETLDALAAALAGKVDEYGSRIRALEVQEQLHRERAAAHEARARTYRTLVGALQRRLLNVMLLAGQARIEGEEFIARVGETQYAEIESPDRLPEAFWRHPAPEPNKDAIRKALLAGTPVEGATLKTRPFLTLK